MALDRLTKIDGGGISTTSDYRVGVITATKFVGPIEGSITATDATFSGNVSIAGTLTYEDVINVDSVGIGTFREGIFLPDNKKLQFGNAAGSADLEIFHSSSENKTIIDNNTNDLDIASDVIRLKNSARSETLATFIGNAGVSLYYDNSVKLGTAGWGIQATGILKIADATNSSGATNHLALGASNDLKLFHDGSHNRIHGSTGFLDINNSADLISITASNRIDISDDFIRLRSRDGSDVYMTGTVNSSVDLYHNGTKKFETTSSGATVTGALTAGTLIGTNSVTSNNNIHLNSDSGKLSIGTGSDLQLFHSGSHSYIQDNGTGALYIGSGGGGIYIRGQHGEESIICNGNGSVDLYYDNSKKLETTNSGVTVTGGVTATGFTLGDNQNIQFGASNDLRIFHNGNHSYIADIGTGDLRITGSAVHIQNAAQSENMIRCFENAQVELYYDNSRKFETNSAGVNVIGNFVADCSNTIDPDSYTNHFITGNVADGSGWGAYGIAFGQGTGKMATFGVANSLYMGFGDGSNANSLKTFQRVTTSGTVELYHNGSKKFETSSSGVKVTGDSYISDSIIHDGDTDTKIRFHADDKFRIELGGITSAFSGLKSTSGAPHAKWGINVATPQAVLHIDEGYNHQGILRVTNGNQNSAYYHQLEMSGTNNVFTLWKHFDGTNYYNTHAHGSTGHFWYISGTERMRIDSSGRVGIGSDTPVAHLDVANYQNIEVLRLRDRHFNKYLTIKGGGSPNRMIIDSYEGGGGGAAIDLASNGTTKLRMDSSGRLQIGSSTLTNYNQFNGVGRLNINNNSADGTVDFSQGIIFTDNVNNNGTWTHAGIVATGSTGYNGNLIFGTDGTGARDNVASNITEKMRITHDGKIGIGIANPDELLHIFSLSGSSKIVLEADNNSANNGIYWVDEGNNTTSEFYYDHGGNKQHLKVNGNGFEIYSKQTNSVIAKIGQGTGYNDLIIPNGDVGIKVANPLQALHVAGSIINSTSVNSTGDQGIALGNGHRLGFDQSGTRSWTMKANAGNLTFNSGDGNGAFDFNTTAHLKLPTGTTAQRVNATGAIRYNSDVGNLEFYTGSAWKRIRLLEDPPTNGLLAYWPFSSASRSGTTYSDESGNNQDLTVNGTITDDTTETKFNGCIDFGTADGNHYLRSSSNSFTDIDASSGYSGVSISVWVKTTVTNNFQQWIISEGGVNTRWNYFVENDYGPKWRSINGGDIHMTGNPGMMTGNWHHLVVTYQSSNNLVKHYRDGSFINQGTTSITPSFTGSYLLIGQHSSLTGNSGSYRWRGKMAHMRLYNRVLSESEITVLSQQW